MKTPIILATTLVLFLFSCKKDESGSCIDADYSIAFTIEEGNTYCMPDGLEIAVTEIKNEFCPCDLECFWEGQMIIEFDFTMDGESMAHTFGSSEATASAPAPYGLTISTNKDDIVFEEECSIENPSPRILEAQISLTR